MKQTNGITTTKNLIKILSVKAALPASFCYMYSKKLNKIYSKHKSASSSLLLAVGRFFFKCKMLMSKYYVVVHFIYLFMYLIFVLLQKATFPIISFLVSIGMEIEPVFQSSRIL